jgi:hypothetical protein
MMGDVKEAMPLKKKLSPKPARPTTVHQKKTGYSRKNRDPELRRSVNDLIEQIDIRVPEMTARIAALEHLLLEKRLCTREDLVSAREFVRIQED